MEDPKKRWTPAPTEVRVREQRRRWGAFGEPAPAIGHVAVVASAMDEPSATLADANEAVVDPEQHGPPDPREEEGEATEDFE